MSISRGTIADLAALLGQAVFSNAEMDQLLFRYGFDIASAPMTIKHKANHLVFGIVSSPEIADAKREQILLELATYALRQPRGNSTTELVNALAADGFRWDGERVVPAETATAPRSASKAVTFVRGEWLPVMRDGLDYLLTYQVVDANLVGEPEERAETRTAHLKIGISRTRLATWGLDDADRRRLEKVVLEYGKRRIQENIARGEVPDQDVIDLTTSSAPGALRYDPDRIRVTFGQRMTLPPEGQPAAPPAVSSFGAPGDPFPELTPRQRDLLVSIVDELETGRYDDEMLWVETFGGQTLTLSGRGGNENKAISDVSRSALRALADEGYISLEERGRSTLIAVKQKALRERRLLPSPAAQPVAASATGTAAPAPSAPSPPPAFVASSPPDPGDPKPPTALMSYAYEGETHRAWVYRLSCDLVTNGVDVILDQWDTGYGIDKNKFMETGVARADRVICILTPEYKRKADERLGGVGVEGTVISEELAQEHETNKFFGVLRGGGDRRSATPRFLFGRIGPDFRDDATYNDELRKLLHELHGVPVYPKPKLGRFSPGGAATGSAGGSVSPPPATTSVAGGSAAPASAAVASMDAAGDAARFKMVIDDYSVRGTPVPMIDSFPYLSREQKADLYDRAIRLKKNHPPKKNPYRDEGE